MILSVHKFTNEMNIQLVAVLLITLQGRTDIELFKSTVISRGGWSLAFKKKILEIAILRSWFLVPGLGSVVIWVQYTKILSEK
jgi:hypothetical protein